MDTLDALLARQHGVFTWAQALAHGISRHRIAHQVKACRWQRLLPRVYAATTGTPTLLMRLQASLLYAGPTAFLSHGSAAVELGLLTEAGGEVHVTTFVGHVRSLPPRLIVHRATSPGGVPPDETVLLPSGLRCSSPARVVLELVPTIGERNARYLASRAARLPSTAFRRALPAPVDLPALLDRRPGHPWTRLLDPIAAAAPASRSGAEIRVLLATDAAGIPGEPNATVTLVDGQEREGDLVYRAERVVVQVESRRFHRENDDDFEYDISQRDDLWVRAGWLVVRVSVAEVENDVDAVVRRVRAAVLQRHALLAG